MDLGELQVFLMVAKEGSFSRAAERLYRTQPAISLAIRKLEDSLGQPLFVRGARPVRLTCERATARAAAVRQPPPHPDAPRLCTRAKLRAEADDRHANPPP